MQENKFTQRTSAIKICLAIIVSTAMFVACSSKSTYQWSKIEIPLELQQSTVAISYIQEMEKLAAEFNKSVHKVAELTGGRNIDNNNEELSTRKTIQLASIALKMSKNGSKMEALKLKRAEVEQDLTSEQQLAFAKIMNQIEAQLGEIDQKLLGISDEELTAYKQLQAKEQAETDSLNTMRDEALGEMNHSEDWVYEENHSELDGKNNASRLETIIFFIVFFAIVGFIAYKFIAGFKNKLQDLGHGFSTMKDTVKKLSDNPSSVLGENKELTNEEKESINKLNNLLNK